LETVRITKLSALLRTVGSQLRQLFTRRHWIFQLTVALPTGLAILYYSLIASDVYLSEARFVLRTPQRPAQSGALFDSILQGTGFSRSQDDSYSVHDYVLSRDALHELDQKLGIRKAFSSHEIDWLERFPGVSWDDSFEALYLYYTKHIVAIDTDSSSSISTLTVRAYTAQEARDISDQLLTMAERLVNNLNERSRQDLIDVAAKEVQLAEERTTAATLALSAFRNKQSLFEPERQSMIHLEGVAKLEEQLVATETQISQVEKVSPTNPQLATLKDQAATLRKAIAEQTAKVAGSRGSLSSKSSSFERLALEKEFAEKQLATAIVALESARNESRRQQLYLERLVQPSLPDKAMEPRRMRSVVMVLALGSILWGVLSLIVASVREHLD
jgi:capsular polysaccharide transport system permease protein